jgi:hypothetical protein
MNLNQLFEGAVDKLEQRRIEDLEMKMDDLAARAKENKDPKVVAALRHEFAKAKAERDSYYHVNEEFEPSPVASAIVRRIMFQHPDLLQDYGPNLVNAAVDNVADYVGDVDEIGSSDVSAWVAQVERMLKENPPEAFDEGFQDFNKVEPYAVCLAGKPVKKFDYYEEARRFHDNWKKKLYREGDKEKADKITLMPLGLDEAGSPAQQAAIAIAMKKAHKKPKHVDEDTGSWIVYDPETRQIKKRFKTHTAGKSYAQTHGLSFASSEYYFDRVKEKETTDEASMSWAAHKPTGPKFGGYLKGTDPAPTEFSKKSVGGCEEDVQVGEGAKVDRMQKYIAKSEKDLGHSKKDAEAIAWATLNKRGYLDNKNKKKHNESVNFMEWAVAQGSRFSNFTSNPEIYARAKEAFVAESMSNSLTNITRRMAQPTKITRPIKNRENKIKKSFGEDTEEKKDELKPGQYYIWKVYFDDGGSQRIKVTRNNFDPTAYYARLNRVVINTDYDWTVHG